MIRFKYLIFIFYIWVHVTTIKSTIKFQFKQHFSTILKLLTQKIMVLVNHRFFPYTWPCLLPTKVVPFYLNCIKSNLSNLTHPSMDFSNRLSNLLSLASWAHICKCTLYIVITNFIYKLRFLVISLTKEKHMKLNCKPKNINILNSRLVEGHRSCLHRLSSYMIWPLSPFKGLNTAMLAAPYTHSAGDGEGTDRWPGHPPQLHR